MHVSSMRDLLLRVCAVVPLLTTTMVAAAPAALPAAAAPGTCTFTTPNGGPSAIQHVIHIQFDNVHFRRDNPNVPSDLEQMPALLGFMKSKGTLFTNDHTGIISHTATGILSSLTGVYGDRMGVPIANSYRYFNPNGTSSTGVSFAYWTDGIFGPATSTPTDTTFTMLSAEGKNAPAPWVAFTRAGCDVGMVATANSVLENIGPDVPKVFGANSPEAAEVAADRTRPSPTSWASGSIALRAATSARSQTMPRRTCFPTSPTAISASWGSLATSTSPP